MRLLRDGVTLAVTPKALATLVVLVRHQGRLVLKRELMDAVWPGVHVEEIGLARNISALRKVLGQGRGDTFIETWPRQGYMFVAAVTTLAAAGESATAAAVPLAIAVLPLKHFGTESEWDYLGLGIADAVIGKLSAFQDVIVRPTNAIRQYGGPQQDPVAAGRTLKVDCVLDGCIQVAENRLRVTVQLVRVDNGATLWAEKYDEGLSNVFTIEDSIAERLAGVFATRLTDRERARLAKRGTGDVRAHQLYLRGRYFWNRRTDEGLRQAIECFNTAIAADPDYGLAYAGLADTHILLAAFAYGAFRPHDEWPRARAAAERALELDEQLAEAHTSLAFIRFRYDWDWSGAEQEFERAIELNPHYATARHWYAYFLSTRGRHEKALSEIRRAQEIDPLSPAIATGIGRFLYFAGRYDEAVSECRKALEIDTTFAGAHLDLGLIYEQLGRYDEALPELLQAVDLTGGSPVSLVHLGHLFGVSGRNDKALEVEIQLRRLSIQSYVAPSDWAVFYLGIGDRATALTLLEQAYEVRTSFMILLNVDPLLRPLRAEPRFQALLARFT